MNASPIRKIAAIGNPESARQLFTSFYQESPAYRRFVDESGGADRPWEAVPVLTKENFYSVHHWKEIIPQRNYSDIFQIVRSSGPSSPEGRTTGSFWPKLKSIAKETSPLLDRMLVETFRLREKRTLVIIGLSLGSWAGGKEFLAAFRAMAIQGGMPLVIFSPGNQHEEILEVVEEFGDQFEEILILISPSNIFYLERLAKRSGRVFPLERIRWLVTGEPFPESLRLEIQERRRAKGMNDPLPAPTMMSIYASSDTGILGYESASLVRLRQFLARRPGLAESLGMSSPMSANLFHANLLDGIVEDQNGELLVTRWQGLPLVRYNLKDNVQLFSWASVCAFMAEEDPGGPWRDASALAYPDLIEIKGRAESGTLSGSNVSEAQLRQALQTSSLAKAFSGTFVAWTAFESGHQMLNLQIELKEGASRPSCDEMRAHYADFIRALGDEQPEFRDDYRKVFKQFESDGLEVIKFHFSPFPHLSDHPRFLAATKRKVFVENGPI